MTRVLEVDCSAEASELTAHRLWELGAIAVEERGGTLVAGFESDDLLTAAIAAVVGARVVAVADGWRDAWKEHARPYTVGRLTVAAAWHDAPGANVVIDPGDVFGYEHATTRAMLVALDTLVQPGTRVLDVGCGSGILSVAAAVLGAAEVVAIDIDPVAVTTTIANAARTAVADRLVVSATPLAEVAGLFDLVLANLGGTQVIVELASALRDRVAPGGHLVVGGMLVGHEQPAVDALAPLRVVEIATDEPWQALQLDA